ncbi:uncharacterized protein BDZ83DRAFT_655234 [Colletotrichum acutatum]|uniref:Uncharacterized protein n=1 Tax=Glomerella acutata TaxID=27357 RepID=A0AAD8XER1_GLOAC|nr:uncharacterized protein BDZ83DRAFT_655234 [Colletotrichum acutatum]KAK1717483.1 hypothetical protein BDZ83DRAFT_655234 [Colletotrichum acutatum]
MILGQVIKEYKGMDRDPTKIHKEVRKRLKDGGYAIPLFSEFMLRLEELRAPTSGSIISNNVNPWCTSPMHKSYTITRDTREHKNHPKRLEQIPYLKRSLIAVWRHEEKAKRRAQRLGTDRDQEHEGSNSDLAVGILRERLKAAEAMCTRLAQEKDSMVSKIDAAEARSSRDGMRIAELEAAEAQGASGGALARIAELEAEIQRLKDDSSTRGSTVHSRSFGDDGFGDGFDFSDTGFGGGDTGHSSEDETPGNPTSHIGRTSELKTTPSLKRPV